MNSILCVYTVNGLIGTTYYALKFCLFVLLDISYYPRHFAEIYSHLVCILLQYEESSSQEVENNINAKIGIDDDLGKTTNSGLCQICYDKKIECIFLPCGHARTCEECATRIKNSGKPCPYCRKSVSTTHRIYL